jgi:hypothetical protein
LWGGGEDIDIKAKKQNQVISKHFQIIIKNEKKNQILLNSTHLHHKACVGRG